MCQGTPGLRGSPNVESFHPKGNAPNGRETAQRRARTRIPAAVARIVGEPGGSAIVAPSSRPVRFPAAPKRSHRRAPANRLRVPRVMVPAKTTLPRAERERTTTQQSPRVAASTSRAIGAGRVDCLCSVEVDVTVVSARVVAAAGVETAVDAADGRGW